MNFIQKSEFCFFVTAVFLEGAYGRKSLLETKLQDHVSYLKLHNDKPQTNIQLFTVAESVNKNDF